MDLLLVEEVSEPVNLHRSLWVGSCDHVHWQAVLTRQLVLAEPLTVQVRIMVSFAAERASRGSRPPIRASAATGLRQGTMFMERKATIGGARKGIKVGSRVEPGRAGSAQVTNGRQAARRCSHVFKTVSAVMAAWTTSEC